MAKRKGDQHITEEVDLDDFVDPRIKNVDQELVEAVFEEFKRNVELVMIHLRDARNVLDAVRDGQNGRDDRGFAKATVLLASAALESNLVYLSGIGLRLAEKRPNT